MKLISVHIRHFADFTEGKKRMSKNIIFYFLGGDNKCACNGDTFITYS